LWSYDLLDEASKELFARPSVFAESFAVGAAEEVCGADLDGLAALVDTSLLKPIRDDRFLMLETIREYALERLEGSPEADELRRRHASFFSAVTEQAYEGRFGAESEWSARLEMPTRGAYSSTREFDSGATSAT
jgi:predicted ATPase